MKLNWHRTGKKEYPIPGTVCLIYFHFVKYNVSVYSEEPDLIDYGDGKSYTNHVFEDAGGFLTNEDLLWIPVAELPPFGSYRHIELPEDYVNDFNRDTN